IQMIHLYNTQTNKAYVPFNFLHQAVTHYRRSRINSQYQTLLSLFLNYHTAILRLYAAFQKCWYHQEICRAIDLIRYDYQISVTLYHRMIRLNSTSKKAISIILKFSVLILAAVFIIHKLNNNSNLRDFQMLT